MEDAAEIYGISSSRLQRLKKMLRGLLKSGQGKTKPKVHLSRKANGAATAPAPA